MVAPVYTIETTVTVANTDFICQVTPIDHDAWEIQSIYTRPAGHPGFGHPFDIELAYRLMLNGKVLYEHLMEQMADQFPARASI